jgi:hypothetical protein
MPKPTLLCQEEFNDKEIGPNDPYECKSSFNKKSTIGRKTRLLIVGTVTPPNAIYFYCSPRNRIYGYIDEVFNDTNLVGHKTDSSCIGIKKILSNKSIAFLDVMKDVIRKKDSPYDKDILFYTLDYDAFKILKNKDVIVIVNSRLAEQGLSEIYGRLEISEPSYIYLSQRRGLKSDWLQAIEAIAK